MNDLSHDAIGADQGLTRRNTVPRALVENNPSAEWIHVDRYQFRHEHSLGYPLGTAEQIAKPAVLGFERVEFFEPGAYSKPLFTQPGILRQNCAPHGHLFGEPFACTNRKMDCKLQRIEYGRKQTAGRLQMIRAMVEAHQQD